MQHYHVCKLKFKSTEPQDNHFLSTMSGKQCKILTIAFMGLFLTFMSFSMTIYKNTRPSILSIKIKSEAIKLQIQK